MNLAVNRDLIAQVVIIVAVSIGGWMLLVEPITRELAELEATIAASSSKTPGISQASVEAAATRISRIRSRVSEVRRRNAMSENTSELYGRIMDLAALHDVAVRRLQPNGDRRQDEDSFVDVSRIDMTLEGAFEDVAAFLDEIGAIGGFTRPSALQITPLDRDGVRLVNARFTCDTIHFALKDALEQLETVANAQP